VQDKSRTTAFREKIKLELLESKNEPGSKVNLKISISKEEISNKENVLLKEYRPQIAIKGFRKGSVPENILRSYLGDELRSEAISKLIPETLYKIIEEKNYLIVSEPIVDKIDESEKALTFYAMIEVKPEFQLCEYKEIPIDLPKYEVAESEVEREIEILKENSATWIQKEGDAENGNGVVIDAKAFDENNKFIENSEKKNQLYEIGLKGNIKEIDDALIGKKLGDKVEVTVLMPEDYFIQEFRGKKVRFEMDVKEIKFKKYPDVNDDFAKEFGEFKTLDELKNRIRDNIGKVKENNYKKEQYNKIEDYLIAHTTMVVPESLIKNQSEYLKQEQKNYLESVGIKDTNEHIDKEEIVKSRNETAEKQVKMIFILDEIAKKENIVAADEDVDREIERIAQMYNKKPLAIKARLEANKTLDGLKREIVRNKVMNFLFENAKRN